MNPKTLGQHLRSKRLLLNLTQDQVAKRLGTIRERYEKWERDEVTPIVSCWPGLICFLGRYPAPDSSPGDQVLKARRMLGLSQYAFGRRIGAIAINVRQWEHHESEPAATILEKITRLTLPPLVPALSM